MAMEEYLKAVKNPYLAKLLEEGLSTSPIQSHWQGAARLAQGLLGGIELGRGDAQQAAMDKGFADLLKQAQGGYEQPSPSATPAPQMPAPRVTTAGQPIGPTAANPYGRPGGAVASSPTTMGDVEARTAGPGGTSIYEEPKTAQAAVPQPASFAQRFQPPAPAGATPVQSVPAQAPQVTQFGRQGIDPTTAAIAGLLYRGGHGAEALKLLVPGELKSEDLGTSIILRDRNGRVIAQYSKDVIGAERQKQQAEAEYTGPKTEAKEAAELKYAGPKAYATKEAEVRATRESFEKAGKPSMERAGGVVNDDVKRVINIIDEGKFPVTGPGGMLFRHVPGSQSNKVGTLIDGIEANLSVQSLNEMRRNSPTGASLGNVSDTDVRLMKQVFGSLSQSTDDATLKYNLQRANNMLMDLIHGPGGGGAHRFDLPKTPEPGQGVRKYNPATGKIE